MKRLRGMRRVFLLALALIAGGLLNGQIPSRVFVIDSVEVSGALPEEEKVLLPEEIAVNRLITDRDSIRRFFNLETDTVVFILTHAFRDRPDSLRQIPSLASLRVKDERLFRDTAGPPYNGPFNDYYLNGRIKNQGTIVDGRIQGYAKMTWPDGSLRESMYFLDNREDGMHEEYFRSGALMRRGKMTAGLQEGYWQEWYSTGRLRSEVYYLHSMPTLSDHYTDVSGLLSDAVGYYRQRNTKAALKTIATLEKLDSSVAEASYYSGLIWLQDGKVDKAMAAFTRAVSLEPEYPEAYQQRGFLILQRHWQNSAQEDLSRACADLGRAVQLGVRDLQTRRTIAQYCTKKTDQ